METGRTCVNLIGNFLATVVVARREGEFDDNRAKVFGTRAEAELDLKSGDIAFAARASCDRRPHAPAETFVLAIR